MRKTTSKAPTALRTAVAAWNHKARETSAPVLRHIFSTIRNLQRLRSGVRHFSMLDPLHPNGEVDDQAPIGALRALCTRLDEFEQSLADLSQQAHRVSQQGESLIRDFRALPLHVPFGGSDGDVEIDFELASWSDSGAEGLLETDVWALDRLIEVQKAEIESLNRQLSDAEHCLAEKGEATSEPLSRSWGQIELQSIQAFVQGSPIATIPINASYYERILEAASAPEGHKVPMGRILTSAGVVTERQLESALGYQREGRRQALGGLLVDLGYTTEEAIAQALAAQLALPYVVLANEPVDPAAVSSVPAHLVRRHGAFPLRFQGQALCVAMANPLDLIALEDLRIASNKPIRPCVAARGDISGSIERYCV